MKKNRFIPCGFEFTIARKKDTPIDNRYFYEYGLHVEEEKLTEKQIKEREEDELRGRECTRDYLQSRLKNEFGIEMELPLPKTEAQKKLERLEREEKERLEREAEEAARRAEGLESTPTEQAEESLEVFRTTDNSYFDSDRVESTTNKPYKDYTISLRHDTKRKLTPYKWINKRFRSDSCGAEITTPIVKKQEDVTKYYEQLMFLVNKFQFTVNLEDAECGLGGCHIHMSLSQFGEVEKHYFLKNIAIFLTNCPELNWGFNDPNDNENANSLLMPVEYLGTTFELGDHRIVHTRKKAVDPLIEAEITTTEYKQGGRLYHFRKDNNIFRLMMTSPLEMSLNKQYSFRYNKNYNTLEFRLFDMPNTLKRHLLHHEVAVSIFNICADYARRHDTMELTYSEFDYNLERSIDRFYKCMKTLGIRKNRVSEMITNIKTRYQWSYEGKEGEEIKATTGPDKYKNYLL